MGMAKQVIEAPQVPRRVLKAREWRTDADRVGFWEWPPQPTIGCLGSK